jgi:hypothetical protein
MKAHRMIGCNTRVLGGLVAMVMAWAVLTAGPAGNAQMTPANLSPDLRQIVKLAQAHMTGDVILSFVRSSGKSYALSANDIIALQGQGVPMPVLTAMIQRYGELRRQTGMADGSLAPAPATAPAPQYASAPVQAPAPAPAARYYSAGSEQPAAASTYVVAPSYPVYEPYYYYDPYYYPCYYPWYPIGGPVVFDFGFGRVGGGLDGHWGGGGHFGGGGRR